MLAPGQKVALFGKVEFDNYAGELTMMHPEFEILSGDDDDGEAALHVGRVVPIYEAAGKVTTRVLRAIAASHSGIAAAGGRSPARRSFASDSKLPDRWTAIRETHFPPPDSDLRLLNAFRSPAQFRLIFEEFFWLECGAGAEAQQGARRMPGIAFELTDRVREQIKAMLPFKPTGAQKRVLGEIAQRYGGAASHEPAAARRRGQRQDHRGGRGGGDRDRERLSGGGAGAHRNPGRAALLLLQAAACASSATWRCCSPARSPAARKAQLKKLIAAGLVHVVIGTHALLEKDVEFKKLGLAIVDEQHRFGVMQRFELVQKGVHPDVLVMTATPIPRTLALTLYGDLDVSRDRRNAAGPQADRHQARTPRITHRAGVQLREEADRRRAGRRTWCIR